MMFQAPAGGAGPEGGLELSAADSALATGVALEEGAMVDESPLAVEAQSERQDMDLGAEFRSNHGAEADSEVAPDAGAAGSGGFGGGEGGAVVMSAPAPPADAPLPTEVPADAAPMQAARRVDRDTLAMKSEAAEAPMTEPVAAAPLAKESAVAESAMRAEIASPAPLLWKDQTFDYVDGTWRQSDYADESLTKIAIPSQAWNALLDQHPDLAALCDRDEAVIVKLGEVWYSISKVPAE
jgi:hypothetical protein